MGRAQLLTVWRWMLDRVWYVHPAVVFVVESPVSDCQQALAEATRPRLDRLQLRNLYMDGRRYYFDPQTSGFRLRTNSVLPWRPRARTSVAAILSGELTATGEQMTRVSLRAQMRLLFFLDIFPVPVFMSSLLIFAPWPPAVIAALIVSLFSLSYAWHRLTAALQATDMVFFVQKVLEDFTPMDAPQLSAGGPEVIKSSGEFHRQWQRFYEQHKDE
jgi:hypothetical protein